MAEFKILVLTFTQIHYFNGNSAADIALELKKENIQNFDIKTIKNKSDFSGISFDGYSLILILSMSSKSKCLVLETSARNGKDRIKTSFPFKWTARRLLNAGFPVKISISAGSGFSNGLYFYVLKRIAHKTAKHALLINIPLSSQMAAEMIKHRGRFYPSVNKEESAFALKKITFDFLNVYKNKKERFKFVCDSMFKGLSKWLRIYGYYAYYKRGIDDSALVKEALSRDAALLTSDAGLLKHNALKKNHLEYFYIPPGLKLKEQFQKVIKKFRILPLEPRCSVCGGEIKKALKEEVKDQIPPKTLKWLNDYYKCSCGKIYWKGSHWKKIKDFLGKDFG